MEPDRGSRLYDLFAQAAVLDAGEREAFLQEHCGGDAALRSSLDALLTSDRTDSFLEPLVDTDAEPPENGKEDPLLGRQIGRYEIVRRLGRGGMGNVYLAVRTEEYSTQVAIKLIRRGMDSETIVRRFHDEMQFQAALGKHANIAQVLDAGETEDGLPYYVMEYVDGERIDRWCDQQQLPIDERLGLFREVCGAVQFAHQNTVIHRDLKPSNILVRADGRPILIDFGIAKVLGDAPELPSADRTQTGMQVLTPEYASPEQIRGERLTTASDVYSLGVVLYGLLTGRRPYRGTMRTPVEALRVVSDTAPQRPSDAVQRATKESKSDSAETTPDEVARARGMAPARLSRALRGDLDRIVLKALHKEPDRRYASAEQLAADVGRYLRGLPVQAQADTWAYRARKFAARNWAALAAAALVFISLIGGGAFSFSQWRRAEGEAVRASRAAHDAQTARTAAEAEAAKAQATVDFLLDDLIQAGHPSQMGYQVTVLDAVKSSLERIDRRFEDEPELEAAVRHTAANMLYELGQIEEAISEYQSSYEMLLSQVGPDHRDTLDALMGLAMAYGTSGQRDKSNPMFREVLARSQRSLGEDDRFTITAMANLGESLQAAGHYEEATELLLKTIELQDRVYPPDDLERMMAMNSLAVCYSSQRKLDEAESIARKILEFIENDAARSDWNYEWSYVIALSRLGETLVTKQQYQEALPYLELSAERIKGIVPATHIHRIMTQARYGRCLWRLERWDEAEPHMLDVYEKLCESRSPDDWLTERCLGLLRDFMYDCGEFDQAVEYHMESLRTRLRIGGRDQGESVLAAFAEFAVAAKERDRYPGDDALYEELIEYGTHELPQDHPHRAQFLGNLGWALLQKDELKRAEPLLLASYEERKETQGMSHGDVHWLLEALIDLYTKTNQPERTGELQAVLDVATSRSN